MRIVGVPVVILLASCLPDVPAVGYKCVETSVSIREGFPLKIPFSTPMQGVYDTELRYRTTDTGQDFKRLEEIAGTAIVESDGHVVQKVELPRHWIRSESFSGYYGLVLIRLKSDSAKSYVLTLEITHVPSLLKDTQAVVRVMKVGRKYAAQ
jgi:hypothetical protein